MDKLAKQRILLRVNTIDVDSLINFIHSKDISLKEMKDNGLDTDKEEEINQRMKKAEEDAKKKLKKDEGNALRERDILIICKKIEDGECNVETIQKYLLNEEISESNLTDHTSLTPELIKKIKSYKKSSTQFDSWDNAPPLEANRTDIYFFGQQGSGKSCILASLFYHFEKKGIMISNNYNSIGVEYRNLLINEIRIGILPDSTMKDKLNFVPIELRNKENMHTHPLNFIEMSGELFKDASKSGFNITDLIKLKTYLDNDNRKLIFFVLDYFQHNNGNEQHQSSFTDILEWLDKSKILDKTDGLYILLSKSDLFPENVNPTQYAADFIDREYLNLKENAKDKKVKHRSAFKIWLFPYTIGDVKYKDLLTRIDEKSPSYITNAIMRHSFVKKKSFLAKLFNK